MWIDSVKALRRYGMKAVMQFLTVQLQNRKTAKLLFAYYLRLGSTCPGSSEVSVLDLRNFSLLFILS